MQTKNTQDSAKSEPKVRWSALVSLRFELMRAWLYGWQRIWRVTDALNSRVDKYCCKLEDNACEYVRKHDL